MTKRVVSLRLKEDWVSLIDDLIEEGHYPSRKDFVMDAVRFYLESHAR